MGGSSEVTGVTILNSSNDTVPKNGVQNGWTDTHINMQNLDGDDTVEKKGKKKKKKKKDEEEEDKNKLPPVPMLDLFRYATTKEKVLMVIGVLAAMAGGVCMPVMFLLFGDVTNAFVYNDLLNSFNESDLPEINDQYPETVNLTFEE